MSKYYRNKSVRKPKRASFCPRGFSLSTSWLQSSHTIFFRHPPCPSLQFSSKTGLIFLRFAVIRQQKQFCTLVHECNEKRSSADCCFTIMMCGKLVSIFATIVTYVPSMIFSTVHFLHTYQQKGFKKVLTLNQLLATHCRSLNPCSFFVFIQPSLSSASFVTILNSASIPSTPQLSDRVSTLSFHNPFHINCRL